METVNGEWIMKGCAADSPQRVRTVQEAADLVRRVGFLPLFSNSIPGFSLEEHVTSRSWWLGDPATDPWEWRQILARREDIAYGKFFEKKAGFISKEWFPTFANYRRNGYDFDALYDDELASRRAKKLMDEFMDGQSWLSFEVKARAGFGKGGEKNFEGTLSDLQMQTYLIMHDFQQKVNKKGEAYGWHIAALEMPEVKWGYEFVTGCYREKPEESFARIMCRVQECFGADVSKNAVGTRSTEASGEPVSSPPAIDKAEIRKVVGIRYPGETKIR